VPGAETPAAKNPVIFRPGAKRLMEEFPPGFHFFGRKGLSGLESFRVAMMALIMPFVPEVTQVTHVVFFDGVFVLLMLFKTRMMVLVGMFTFWTEMAFSPVVAFLVRLVMVVLHKKSSLFVDINLV
jgi:hypothetical protein